MKPLNKKLKLLLCAVISGLIFGILAIYAGSVSKKLYNQQAAERWSQDGDYSQISVFLSDKSSFSKSDIADLQTTINEKLTSDSLKAPSKDVRLWYDAWSTDIGKMKMTGTCSEIVTAQVTAVDGDFFAIHPFHLQCGCYFTPTDLMQDRVIIDTNLAWKTFGSSDVDGMEIAINGQKFTICGVVEPDKQYASKISYGETPRMYISAELANKLQSGFSTAPTKEDTTSKNTEIAFTCYEAVLPNPVRNFAMERMKTALDERENIVILENTGRTSLSHRWNNLKKLHSMLIAENGILYPHWENSARIIDFDLAILLAFEILFLILPVFTFLFFLWKGYRWLENWVDAKKEAYKRRYRSEIEQI
ncbi:MAG: ABC transporter permease [Oscillospiraceae bacterium]